MSNFKSTPLSIPDVLLITPPKFMDDRGYFMETYNLHAYRDLGISGEFMQDNQSFSATQGTIRGLHFQKPPLAQAKLVRVLLGSIYDVAVDLRRNSSTYGQWCGAPISASDGGQIFVPAGFAHGFCTLEANTIVAYKVDAGYAPQAEAGLRWNDETLAIDWPLEGQPALLSTKDAKLPDFKSFVTPF